MKKVLIRCSVECKRDLKKLTAQMNKKMAVGKITQFETIHEAIKIALKNG